MSRFDLPNAHLSCAAACATCLARDLQAKAATVRRKERARAARMVRNFAVNNHSITPEKIAALASRIASNAAEE